MAYPIKYIENNLVFNHDGECFAYYELLPYNYSFLSPEQKYQVHDSFRQLIAQNRDGKIHALQISTESSIRAAQERSKQEVTGKLKDVACAKIDAQTEALISMIGENQVDYRFFIGFKLLVNEQEVTMKQFHREAKTAISDFLHEVNHKLMGDFVSMSNEEIWRFQKMEKLLENKISRRFKVRRLNKDDFGYLIEHPDLAEKMKAEVEGILLWVFEGLQRLAANNFKFTESDRTRENREAVKRENNNVYDFLDSDGYVRLKADMSASSKELCMRRTRFTAPKIICLP